MESRPIQLELYFRAEPVPQLELTVFVHPDLPEILEAHLGTGPGGFGRRTKGPHALGAFVLHQVISARMPRGHPGPIVSEFFEGKHGTPAATLNNALSRRSMWLREMFGVDSEDRVLFEFLIDRKNRDFTSNRTGALGIRFLFNAAFTPSDITIYVNDQRMSTPEEISALYRAVLDAAPFYVKGSEQIASPSATPVSGEPRPPAALLCPPPPSIFVGREDLMASLAQELSRPRMIEESGPQKAATIVLRGWPGVGKSTFAAALCHSPVIRREFPDGILWACLGQAPNLCAILASWAAALGVQLENTTDAARCSLRLAAAVRDGRVLLVVDDVWRASDCSSLLIAGPRAGVVFTTRLPEVAHAVSPRAAGVLEVPPLSERAALDLLAVYAPEAVQQESELCIDLVRSIQGLPLAIRVAGRMLALEATTGLGVAELLAAIRSDTRRLLAEPPPPEPAGLLSQTAPTVAALLRRSTDTLPEQARNRFIGLGALAPHPATFDLEVMRAIWQIDDARPTVRTLISRGLLEHVNDRYQMHALLVAHAKSLWDDQHASLPA